MSVTTIPFGTTAGGEAVTAYRLTNSAGASLTVLDYGAIIQSLCVPNGQGGFTDVVLGYDTVREYEENGGFLGATIGRAGNRIGGAAFSLNGVRYELARNDGDNHLHGGVRGFDKRMWQVAPGENALVCARLSPDGEEGYPGNLQVQVTFTLTEDNTLSIQYDALSDRDTPVNLTNHSYFNLNGGGSVLDHQLYMNAERFCENDAGCLPTGQLLWVEGTPFDFRTPKAIGADIGADCEQLRRGGGAATTTTLCSPAGMPPPSTARTAASSWWWRPICPACRSTPPTPSRSAGARPAPPWPPGMPSAWKPSSSPMA